MNEVLILIEDFCIFRKTQRVSGMIGRRLPKNRKFSYQPRFYDPEKEEKEGRGIKFKRQRSKSVAKKRSLVNLIVLVGVLIYLVYFLSRLSR